MLRDVMTVLWKETREILFARNARGNGRSIRGLLIPVLMMGAFWPGMAGPMVLKSPMGVILWSWVFMSTAAQLAADAVAGERERHTLETLLATRLPDRAILYGKLLSATLISLGLALSCVVIAPITINLFHREDGITFYTAKMLLAAVVFPALLASLGSVVGLLMSLRAASAREAVQAAALVITLPPMLIGLVMYLLRKWAAPVIQMFTTSDGQQQLIAGVTIGLLVLVLLLIRVAERRFHRLQLI